MPLTAYSHNQAELLKSFFKAHGLVLDVDAWQVAVCSTLLQPVASTIQNTASIDIKGRISGFPIGYYDAIKSHQKDRGMVKARSIFGSYSACGVIFEDDSCAHQSMGTRMEKYLTHVKDVHRSRWRTSLIDAKSNLLRLFYYDYHDEFEIEDELLFCVTTESMNSKIRSYVIGSNSLWMIESSNHDKIRNIVSGGSPVMIERYGNSRASLLARSNNAAVFDLGAKTLVITGEDAFALDTRVSRCYISPRCVVLDSSSGLLFSSHEFDKKKIAQCLLGISGGADSQWRALQSMLDPELACHIGMENDVRAAADWICRFRWSAASAPAVKGALQGNSSYSLMRMFQNDK